MSRPATQPVKDALTYMLANPGTKQSWCALHFGIHRVTLTSALSKQRARCELCNQPIKAK